MEFLTLKQMKSSITNDITESMDIKIMSETPYSITVYDNADGIYNREYTLTDPAHIDRQWLRNRTIITPDITNLEYKFDIYGLIDQLDATIDKNMLINMDKIIFCTDSDESFDYLSQSFDTLAEGENDLPYDMLGIMWHDTSDALINVGEIIKTTKEMAAADEIENYEIKSCINRGVIETLVHEIRHLAQANPYLPEEYLCQETDNDEADAEQYARDFFDSHSVNAEVYHNKNYM